MNVQVLDALAALDYHDGAPTPQLADALGKLTDDGDQFELLPGWTLRLSIVPDDDASINDYDGDGKVEWTRNSDYGAVRPDGFTGRARVIERDGRQSLWWEPHEVLTEEQILADEPRIIELVTYGFNGVLLKLYETLTDSLGNTHRVKIADASIWGVDQFYPELIPALAAEIEHDLRGASAS